MYAVGLGRERHIDAIVDQQRDIQRRQHDRQLSRLLYHGAGGAMFVAQLHQRRAAGDATGQVTKRAAAGDGGIDNSIEAKIDIHQFTRACAMSVGPSRLWRASMIATAKLAGPSALAAANSPATPTITSAAAVARHASCSTLRQAAISADAAQPMAVTLAISGCPLAIVPTRSPSVTRSVSPDSPMVIFLSRA